MGKRDNAHHDQPRDRRGRWAYLGKCERITIRCTTAEYAAIRHRADVMDASVSRYLLWLVATDIARNMRPL